MSARERASFQSGCESMDEGDSFLFSIEGIGEIMERNLVNLFVMI